MIHALVVIALILTVGYALVNSFHDVPNATAIPVRHRALSPVLALMLAAGLNVVGVVAATILLPLAHIEPMVVEPIDPAPALGVIICTLLTTIGWDLLTWWWGLPASTTSAFMGGIVGATVALGWVDLTADLPLDAGLLGHLVVPVILAPLVAFALAWVLVIPSVRGLRHVEADQVRLLARVGMVVGSTGTNVGHGLFHGQRVLLLMITIPAIGGLTAGPIDEALPWAMAVTATAFAVGSLLGAWRIARTISSRMVSTDALRGGVAQGVSGLLLFAGGLAGGVSMSTSQTTAAAVLGTGTNQKYRSTNYRVVGKVLLCWLLTAPVCAVVAGTLVLALSPLLG
ncbi:inorganic phosphate transporter [Kocuria coralli]|uniref:Inorganic phosphate transporter n=1 Tax=Kocuria coralli TaxID=1461025 RepID=A0A5J5KZ78_9MICC|nr:inorganic phosphate transporter [Kocuria coralli]KAA9394146.1 inorganic phosphate transporter [Kocuria coralli]